MVCVMDYGVTGMWGGTGRVGRREGWSEEEHA